MKVRGIILSQVGSPDHNNAHIRMTQMQQRSENKSLHMHVNGVASNPTVLSHKGYTYMTT